MKNPCGADSSVEGTSQSRGLPPRCTSSWWGSAGSWPANSRAKWLGSLWRPAGSWSASSRAKSLSYKSLRCRRQCKRYRSRPDGSVEGTSQGRGLPPRCTSSWWGSAGSWPANSRAKWLGSLWRPAGSWSASSRAKSLSYKSLRCRRQCKRYRSR